MLEIATTCANRREALRISRALLRARLVACVNIFPIESLYWWKGKIKRGREIMIFAKTTKDRLRAVETMIHRLHSYEVPYIAAWTVDAAEPYAQWLRYEFRRVARARHAR